MKGEKLEMSQKLIPFHCLVHQMKRKLLQRIVFDDQQILRLPLGNLADSDDGKAKVIAGGGIETVITAMRQHSSHAGVQQEGCGALCSRVFCSF